MNITIGADPEVFVTSDGIIVPVVGHLGGTKALPLPVAKGAVQEDNVLAEFNIDPARTSSEFVGNLKAVMGQLKEKLHPLDIDIVSSHRFTKDMLLRSGRQALAFGCDPDYNAYTGKKNNAPSPRTVLRTAGGHIHVGYDNPTPEMNRNIVRAMDVFLGLPSVLLDDDKDRRMMYGQAGAYRDKDYGVEYRTLSNFWLKHTSLMKWAYDNTIIAVEHALENKPLPPSAEATLNSSMGAAALDIIQEVGVPMP